MIKRCYWIIPSAFLVISAAAAAQEAAHIGKVVVTATRAERDLAGIPADVEVLGAGELEALPGAGLDEKLASISGADTLRQNGIYSFSSVVALRGLSAAEQGRTLLLLDGVPVNTSATGAVNWNRLNLEEIERVEVFKGPASSLYGSNAAGGVINIITKKPFGPASAAAGGTYGTFNTYSAKAQGGGAGEKFYAQGSAYYLKSDGYISTPVDQRTSYSTARNVLERDAGLRAGWRFSEHNTLDAAVSYYDGLRGEGTKIYAGDGLSRRYRTQFARASWQGKSDAASWQANAYYQNERYGRISESFKNSAYQRIDSDGNRVDAGIQSGVSLPAGEALTVTPGIDAKTGSVDTDDTYITSPYSVINNRGKLNQYSPYVQLEAKALDNRLNLLAGLRYDRANFYDGSYNNPTNPGWGSINGSLPGHSWEKFSPRVSAGWKYSDAADQYVSYGRGFRPPNLEDLCLSLLRGTRVTVANPDLNPETVDTFETGLRLNPARGLSVEPVAYYTKGHDFLYEINTGQTVNISGNKPIYKKQNVSEVEIYGAELAARYEAGGGVAVIGNYAYNHSRVIAFPQNAALEGKTLTYNPSNTAYAGVEWQNPAVNLSGGARYKDGQYTNDDNTQTVNAYATLAAKAWKTIGAVTAAITLDNILDERYQESETDMAPGRTLTAQLSVKF